MASRKKEQRLIRSMLHKQLTEKRTHPFSLVREHCVQINTAAKSWGTEENEGKSYGLPAGGMPSLQLALTYCNETLNPQRLIILNYRMLSMSRSCLCLQHLPPPPPPPAEVTVSDFSRITARNSSTVLKCLLQTAAQQQRRNETERGH